MRALWSAVLALLLLRSLAAAEPPPVPEWLRNINPGDYVLVNADLPTGWQVFGDINAEATAQGYRLTDAQGKVQEAMAVGLMCTEQIARPDPNDPQMQLGSFIIWVGVYESPEVAIGVIERFGLAGGDPANTDNLNDPRTKGHGGAVSYSRYGMLRYDNIVMRLEGSGAEDDAAPWVPKLMKAFLDKICGKEVVKWPDLRVTPQSIHLSLPIDQNVLPHDPHAGIQAIVVQVDNVSADVAAPGVMVQFSTAVSGAAEPTALGDAVPVGVLPPGGRAFASLLWNLEGANVRDVKLSARAFIPGHQDANPDDNGAGLQVSISYAHNGERPFDPLRDSYKFGNYRFSGRETEELIDGFVTTMLGNLDASEDAHLVMQRIFYPQTFLRLRDYLDETARSGSKGHCFGMATSAALYFMEPELRPGGKSTSALNLDEAGAAIALYHRAQMSRIADAVLRGGKYLDRQQSVATCLDAVRASLQGPRQPIVMEFFGQIEEADGTVEYPGHAVLAYKLIEIVGRQPVVYVYDPNHPPSLIAPPRPLSQFTLSPGDGDILNPIYMGYPWKLKDKISAYPPRRQMPVEVVNEWYNSLKSQVRDLAGHLRQTNRFMAVVREGAQAIFRTNDGKVTQVGAGEPQNDIPNAEVRADGSSGIVMLPADQPLSVTLLTDSRDGGLGLDLLRAEGEGTIGLTSYQRPEMEPKTSVSGRIETGGQLHGLVWDGGGSRATIYGRYDGEKIQSGRVVE